MILKNNKKAGFSLLELLIYMSILSGFLIIIVNIFFMISINSAKEKARTEVEQNLKFAIEQITNEIMSSNNNLIINNPSTIGSSENILNFQSNTNIEEFRISSTGILQRIKGTTFSTCASGDGCKINCTPIESDCLLEDLTSNKVTVTIPVGIDKIFTRIGNTIQINLEMSYNDNGRPGYEFSKKMQTTVFLK